MHVPFLETDKREQNKYEKRLQTFVDNTVNDLNHDEIKFENCVKNKNSSFVRQSVAFRFLKKMYFNFGDVFF